MNCARPARALPLDAITHVAHDTGDRRYGLNSAGVDNQRTNSSPVFVRRLRPYIALVLLALWMPATLRCEMEMAGLFAECGPCQDEKARDGAATDCDADGSGMIESSALRLPSPVFLLKAFDLTGWLLMVVVPPEIASSPLLSLERTAAPAELIQSWHFVRRAAPPPRAPSFLA